MSTKMKPYKCRICGGTECYTSTSRGYTQRRCQECQKKKTYENYHKAEERNKGEKNHRYQLQQKYGITIDTYNTLLHAQGGTCAICNAPPNGRRLSVDHNHTTGIVRGLLCSKCNTGLGNFGDSRFRLQRAIKYLMISNT